MDQAEEDRNALGHKLGILCDIPGKCGQVRMICGSQCTMVCEVTSCLGGRLSKHLVCGNPHASRKNGSC